MYVQQNNVVASRESRAERQGSLGTSLVEESFMEGENTKPAFEGWAECNETTGAV